MNSPGGVRLKFYCINKAGHAYVEAKIESEAESAGVVQLALIAMPVEAAAIDDLVRALAHRESDELGVAQLDGLA